MTTTLFRTAIAVALLAFLLPVATVAQQSKRPTAQARGTFLGEGMGTIIPGLIEVASKTNLFLAVADRINLTEGQRRQLTDIAFQLQRNAGERKGDLGVARAEFQRMLGRDRIDLEELRLKLSQVRSLETDIEYLTIEALLSAIRVLTHQQHLLAIGLAALPGDARARATSSLGPAGELAARLRHQACSRSTRTRREDFI